MTNAADDAQTSIAQLTEVVHQLITSVACLEEWRATLVEAASRAAAGQALTTASALGSEVRPFATAELLMRNEVTLWESRVRLAEDEERRLHQELISCVNQLHTRSSNE